MRTWRVLLLIPAALWAQQSPTTTLRGVLLERDIQLTGEFSVRAADDHVLRYRFDDSTSVDFDQLPRSISRLQPGDQVEVISDERPETSLRYASAVHVLESAPQRPVSRNRYQPFRPLDPLSVPKGTLTYAGVIFRVNQARMVLHTREAGDQTILLRQDTRYLDNGDVGERADLQPNMRVFVSAGRTLFNEVEAYQVIWGEILRP